MKAVKQSLKFLPLVGILLLIGLVFYGLHLGIFKSPALLQNYIGQFGDWGILLFIFLQIVQVIIPILPGGISSVAGMLLFGNLWGLLYSYIGLVIGEILVFVLVRRYGHPFVRLILSDKKYQSFEKLTHQENNRGIKKLLIVTLLIPFAPDDLVCLVAGMSAISFKDYLKIIILLKPWSIAVYSYILVYLFEHNLFTG
ncbi:TVP38/TMEM64 family protein [Enterococcus sp. LJL90]